MNTEIELSPKQTEYIQNAHSRWNIKIGATQCGKTFIDVQYMIPQRILDGVGKNGLNAILGVSKETIERNVLEPMRDIWGEDLISGINSRNIATLFGEKVYCLGAEKASQVAKIRGAKFKYLYIDEIVDIHPEVFELVKSRLSLPYSVCDAAGNPSYPSHFVKRFIDSADNGVDVYCQHWTLYDNPFLDPSYIKAMEAEYTGTVYFDRYVLGRWCKAEGLVYPMYQKAIGEVPGDTPNETCISIDYGTYNAFVALLWEKHGDIWYCAREYYYSGRTSGIQKTDEEYGNDLDEFTEGINNMIDVIIDPSAASFITLLKRKSKYRVLPAINNVANGIRDTATAMQKGCIKISPRCKNWKLEVEGYVWSDGIEDRPIKENDHAMDAMRYFVESKRIAVPHSRYRSVFER